MIQIQKNLAFSAMYLSLVCLSQPAEAISWFACLAGEENCHSTKTLTHTLQTRHAPKTSASSPNSSFQDFNPFSSQVSGQFRPDPSIPVQYFTAESSEQSFVSGSQAFYRLKVDAWKPQILSTHRGAELYGGPRWSVSYSKVGSSKVKTLPFKKEGSARLGVHPDFILNLLSDKTLSISHKLIPIGFHLIDQVTLTNLSQTPLKISHYQMWDLYLKPIASPLPTTLFREIPGSEEINSFTHRMFMQEKETLLTQNSKPYGVHLERSYPKILPPGFIRPNKEHLVAYNYYPANVDVTFSNPSEIFKLSSNYPNPGSTEYSKKESLAWVLEPQQTYGPVWVGNTELILGANESQTFESTLTLDTGEKTPLPWALAEMKSLSASDIQALKPMQSKDSSQLEHVRSELVFNMKHLKALSTWDATTQKFITTQGAYYLDQYGVHTALRDFTNTVVGLAGTVPELARSNLEYCYQLQDAHDSYLPYLWSGNFKVRRELKIRSDLSPSLIWASTEVMKHHLDWDWFYKAQIPFYPPTSSEHPPGANGNSPFDHVRAAFNLLRDHVGVGKNGLPHAGMGDWSDSLISLAGPEGTLAYYRSIAEGESPMLGQMALVVLTDLVALLEQSPNSNRSDHQEFKQEILSYLSPIRIGLRSIYNTNTKRGHPFFPRAILRDAWGHEKLVLSDTIDVAGQVWSLMGGDRASVLNPDERNQIIDQILAANMTDMGVMTVNPPAGADANYFRLQGRPWSVIRSWFTAALVENHRFDEAWDHLWRTTLAHHNETFADRDAHGQIRNQLVSGYDGWNLDGLAWSLPSIPMNASRWNNSNHPAMFLWSAMKVLRD